MKVVLGSKFGKHNFSLDNFNSDILSTQSQHAYTSTIHDYYKNSKKASLLLHLYVHIIGKIWETSNLGLCVVTKENFLTAVCLRSPS